MPDWVAYGGGGILGLGGGAFCALSLIRYFRQRRADRDKEQAPRMEDDL